MITEPIAGVKSSSVKIDRNSNFPLIPIQFISLPERPEPGSENANIFYNPRSIESFTHEEMNNLRESIRVEGLQTPPIVRAITDNGRDDGKVVKVELVAGERRYRSLMWLFSENIECYDSMSKKTVEGSKLYKQIPCKVLWNISDQKALKIAFEENHLHEKLCVTDEIALVERFIQAGWKQEAIAEMIGTNVTWVSQTGNFRQELPAEAFAKLLEGKLTRHVAVQILAYHPEDRERLFRETLRAEAEERQRALCDLDEEFMITQDQKAIAMEEHRFALSNGDKNAALQANRDLHNANIMRQKLEDRRAKVETEAGVIRQGHITVGARNSKVAPKKAKMLSRPEINTFYLESLNTWINSGKEIDPVTKIVYPEGLMKLMRMTAEGIVTGQTNPGDVLRKFLIESGAWSE